MLDRWFKKTFSPAIVLVLLASGAAAQGPIPLSLSDAIRRAIGLGGNAAVGLAAEKVAEADAESRLAKAPLLPHIAVSTTERRQTVNLEAMGIRSFGLFRPPKLVGPFSTFDARGEIQQQVFDLPSIRRYRSASVGLEGAEIQVENTRDEIAFGVALAYLEALRGKTALAVARSELALAQELLELASQQKDSGTGTRIEVTRAEVQLAERRQRLLASEVESRNSLLKLLRIIGMDLSTSVELENVILSDQAEVPDEASAFSRALEHRSDWQLQEKRVTSARLLLEAERAERWPSLAAYANYGSSGEAPNDSIPTWSAGLMLTIPVYDGGAIEARRAKALSRLRQEEIRTEDLKQQILLEVEMSLSVLRTARESLQVAESGLELARAELEQAKRRYRSGITTSLEVTDAQTRIARAEQNRIDADFGFSAAAVALADAMGSLRSDFEP